jgi:hypothetical protein
MRVVLVTEPFVQLADMITFYRTVTTAPGRGHTRWILSTTQYVEKRAVGPLAREVVADCLTVYPYLRAQGRLVSADHMKMRFQGHSLIIARHGTSPALNPKAPR